MTKRNLVLLAIATAILVGAVVATLATGDRQASPAAANQHLFPGLAAELGNVASVELRRTDLTATFTRHGADWQVVQKGGYRADAGKVRQIVLALADLTLVEPKTSQPDLYPRLEVEEPGKGKSSLVTVKDQSGSDLARVIVGKRRYDRLGAGNDGVYVRKPGDPQSWLARGSIDLSGDMASWLDRHILNILPERIAKVALAQPDGTSLVLSRTKPEANFAAIGAPANAKFKSDTATGEPAMALETLDLGDVVPKAAMPVPEKGVTTASFTTFDGLTIDLRLFDHDKTNWVAIAAAGSGKAAAEAKSIDGKVSGWRYAIPSYKAQTLRTRLADLIEPAKGS